MALVLVNKNKDVNGNAFYISEDFSETTNILNAKIFNSEPEALKSMVFHKIDQEEWAMIDSDVAYGYINFFNEEKEFGFIKSKGRHFFVHLSAFNDSDIPHIKKDTLVKFTYIPPKEDGKDSRPKKPVIKEIVIVE